MSSSFWSGVSPLDILRNLPAPGSSVGYDELVQRAVTTTMNGYRVQIASLDDIILSKETVNRQSDRVALPELRELQAEPRRADTPPQI